MVRSSAPWRRLVTLGLVLVVLLTACAPKLAQPDRLKKAEQLYATVLELYAGGRFAEAIPLAQEAHAIRKNVLGPRHPVTTTSLDILGVLCVETGAYAQARSLLEEALATSKAVLGLRHPDTATTLNNLGVLYVKTGAYAQAQPLLEEALAISKAVLGLHHSDTATTLHSLATLHLETGAYAQAQPLLEDALIVRKEVLGPRHRDTVQSRDNLAELYFKMGAYAQAQPLLEEALAIRKAELGPRHLGTASSLNNLGALYLQTGAYAQAQPLLEEALVIRKAELGPRHPDTVTSLNNLGTLYLRTGAYAQAQPLLEDAVAISKEVLGPRHPDTGMSLSYLGGLYLETGAYAQARPLLEDAVAISKEVLGPRHSNTAGSLNNLAQLYVEIGAYVQARLLYEEAVVIHKTVLGPRHPETAVNLDNLAGLYSITGTYAQAQLLYEEAVAIRKTELGPRHPETAASLDHLGGLYIKTGAYAQAQPLLEEALEIRKVVLGPRHPITVDSLSNLTVLAWGQDQWVTALHHLRRAVNVQEVNLRSLLPLGDESRKRAYMATLERSTYITTSFAGGAAAHVPEAINLGLEVVLQRKGRVLDALAESLARIRRSATPEDQALWARYVAVQTDWAAMTLRGPSSQPVDQYRARLAELEQQAGQVATELSSRSSQFRTVLEPVALAQVQRAIPPRAVLLEWVRYHPFNPKAIKMEPSWGAPRYAVYVLKPHGAPVFVDLGEADILDRQIADLLAAMRYPGGMQGKQVLAHDLYRRLIQPVQVHLGSATNLFLSPDGQLNLLPFGLLQESAGRALADQYELTYLTSGRDLLRPTISAEASRPSLLIADPDFDASIPAMSAGTTALSLRRSADIDRDGIRFDRLPGTAQEARDLSVLMNLHPTQVLTNTRATEAAVKQARSPRILHLATHGFFLSNLQETFPSPLRGVALELGGRLPVPRGEHPLLRSGLALAGANQRQSGTDDGILTALEVANLDLTGTQLVVLSACETGVGDVRNGEGVYGLRRALVLAGVRTQVVSLWKVDDAATQAFMGHYYRYVLKGMGRSAALRATQQKMRHDPKHPEWADPYYWAAFVVIGDPTPLSDEPLSSSTKKRK